MTGRENTYEEMKKAIDEIAARRIDAFLKELDAQMRQAGQLKGKVVSATTIDNWLRRAESQARLDIGGLHKVAFEVWRVVIEASATISQQDACQIVPIPNIQESLVRSIAEHFAQPKDA